jgi:phosphoserine phosphatase
VAQLHDTPPPYALVVFDCDSTLSAIEGIDELAAAHGVDVRALTDRAMRGEIPLEEVYASRLDLIRPSRASVEAVGALYVERMLPHARDLVAAVRGVGKRCAIVSGGLEPAVSMLARAAGFDARDVFSVAMRHDPSGEYLGFDAGSPLARSGGKIELVRELVRESGFRPFALVGDGVTDLEAVEMADSPGRFVAFGGVARRENVLARAAVKCERADLAALVPHLFSRSEIDFLAVSSQHAALVRASRELG